MSAKTVLFPTDFSTVSDAALAQATGLARGLNARMVIFHVEEPPLAYAGGEFYYGVPEPSKHVLRSRLFLPRTPCPKTFQRKGSTRWNLSLIHI